MKKLGLLALAVLVAVIAHMVFRAATPEPARIVVPLVAGPPQPKVSPGEAGIDAVAIQAAVDYAGKHGSTALVIARGGHIVFEKYWGDVTLDTAMEPGNFGSVIPALLVGSAMNDRLIANLDEPVADYLPDLADTSAGRASIRDHLGARVEDSSPASPEVLARVLEKVTGQNLQTAVSERLWKPMGAGEFSVRRAGAIEVGARIADWMRIGEMLANEGVFEGNQFTPPRYVTLMMKPAHTGAALGLGIRVDGEFAADVAWLEDGPNRLWVVPSLQLAILRAGKGSEALNEAMIPDSIIRGSSGWRPRSASDGVDPKKFAPH